MPSVQRTSRSDTSHLNTDAHTDDDARSFTNSILSRSSISTSRSSSLEIGQEQIEHIHDAFAVFDKEMTGSITTEQFRSVRGTGF